MTVIKASCPVCGDVRLNADEVTIRTCVGKSGGEYRWKCKCGIVVKHAEQPIIDILRASGLKEEIWELPLELIEHPVDGSLSEDDLIDLVLAFEDGSAYEKITKKPEK